ncbi:MAG: HAMP domain-containing histidine kinase [Bacteroidetes bacterium]|nr:HAMP domain-containing histidine kinase [Bacteroidota bacterium]MBI3481869.1 HAMP domain-containing histidine kinase [Bacteroidota bacterium]
MVFISKVHNFFVPIEAKQDEYLVYRYRLILNASLSTSLFSLVYLIISLLIQFEPGVYLMIFNVAGFALIPFLIKGKFSALSIGNFYVWIGSIAVMILICFSGGLQSPIFPWLIAPPVLALLIVNRVYALVWTGVSVVCVSALTLITNYGYIFPIRYNTDWSLFFSFLCSSGIILIVVMIAMFFEGNIKEALTALTERNTEILEKNEELLVFSEQLKELNDKKNDLMYLIAHDLKSPLANMQALIWLTKMKNEGERLPQAEAMVMIGDQIKKMQALIQKILSSENFEHIAYNLKLEEIDLSDLAQSILSNIKNMADNKEIAIQFVRSEGDFKVLSDKIYLSQVIENLVNNAIKFSPVGKKVTVSVKANGEFIHTSIKDEGPGIKQEEIGELFKKFSKISNRPTAGESSSGLGLAIVKQYAELLNGRVWCESEFGNGCNFIAEFPKYQKTPN